MSDDSASPIDITLVDKIAPTIAPKIEAIAAAARQADDAIARLQAQLVGINASAVDKLAASVTKQNQAYLQEEAALNRAVKAETDAKLSHVNLQNAISGTTVVKSKAVQETEKLIDSHTKLGVSTLALREPFTLLREGITGNYTRMIGSSALLAQGLGQLGNVVKLLPFLAAAGGILALKAAADSSVQSAHNLNFELNGVGAVAGVTAKEFADAALAGQRYSNMSISASRELAKGYLDTGKIGGSVLIGLTAYTKQYGQVTGENAKQAEADLIKIFSDPAKGAIELNAKLGILNGTEIERIQRLQDEGRVMEAQQVLWKALENDIDKVDAKARGLIGTMHNLGTALSNALHTAIIGAGGGSLDEQLALAQLRVKMINSSNPLATVANNDTLRAATKDVADLTNEINKNATAHTKAAAAAKADLASQTGIATARNIAPDNSLRTMQDELAKVNAALDAEKHGAHDSAANVDLLNQAHQRLADTVARYIPDAQREHQVAELQAKAAATLDRVTKGSIETKIRQLQLNNQLLSNQELMTKAQDAGNIVADKAVKAHNGLIIAADTRVNKLQDELANQEKINAAVANGSLTIGQAIQAISSYNRIAQFQAEVDEATGKEKAQLLKIMPAMIAAQTALTAAQKDFAQLKTNESAQQANDLLQTQIDLTGKDIVMRDLEIARVKTLQQLQKDNTDPSSTAGQRALQIAQDSVYLQQQNKISEIVNKLADEYHDLRIEEAALIKEQSLHIISDTQFGIQMTQLRLKALNLGISLGTITDANSLLTASFGKMLTGFNGVLPTLTDDFGNFFTAIEDGAGRAFGAVLTGSESAQQAIQQLSQSVLSDLIGALVKLGIQWAIQQALGDTLAATSTAASTAQATALYAAWEPAAIAVGTVTFGAADAASVAALTAAITAGKVLGHIPGFAGGGMIGGGGSGRSDSNLIRASRGEFIVNADATSKYFPLLEMMNGNMDWFHAGNAQIPQYANGGYVSGGSSVGMKVEIHNYGTSKDFEVEMDEGTMRIIARDEIQKRVPKMLGGEIRNANSPLSKGIARHTHTRRNSGAT
jgi:hypothetical protein